METLKQLGVIPVDHPILRSIFSEYRFPKNKIASLEDEGKLIRLKKGVYIVSPKVSGKLLSLELIANHLYGPSYVSLESALRYYGLIPEQVQIVRSVTANRSKSFKNQLALFQYTHIDSDYYPIGITQITTDNRYTFLIASPEKALCDMIISTHRLYFQSLKSVQIYLEEDLRFDIDALKNMDITIIERCLAYCKKRKSIEYLLKFIRQ